MSAPIVQGWCPGAHKPMMSGDGLVVRIRPWVAQISAKQAEIIADAAQQFGSGYIDLTNRANLQIRGVAEQDLTPLLAMLEQAGLLDNDAETEARRNVILTPEYQNGDLSHRLYDALVKALPKFPRLPGKFGFVIDCGSTRVLHDTPGDIRFETGPAGIIIRAAGSSTGVKVDEARAIAVARDLAQWFCANRPDHIRRMDRLLQTVELPTRFTGSQSGPRSAAPDGYLYAPFGQIEAHDMRALGRSGDPIRISPWRAVKTSAADDVSLLTDANDPLLRVSACAGKPLCPQASVETRELAAALAGKWNGTLHVSGCAKGCAKPAAADVVFVGENGRFNLVRNGRAWDEPSQTNLTPDALQNLDLT